MLFTSCIIYVYQYNRIYIYLLKKQHRNKIGILGDSSIFTLHLISFFALGLTKMLLKAISPTIYTYRKNIVWLCIDELCSQKERSNLDPRSISPLEFLVPAKLTISIKS